MYSTEDHVLLNKYSKPFDLSQIPNQSSIHVATWEPTEPMHFLVKRILWFYSTNII